MATWARFTSLLFYLLVINIHKHTPSFQVTFLHVYHHSLMMVGSWAFLKFTPSESVVFMGLLNSLVHVFMYAYYGLTALGPAVAKHLNPYKKYITRLQLVSLLEMLVLFLSVSHDLVILNESCMGSNLKLNFVPPQVQKYLSIFNLIRV